MNDQTQQLRERILKRLHEDEATNYTGPPPIDLIMQDVQVWHEVQAVKRERQAYARGWNDKHASATYGEATPDDVRVTVRYPSPTRTREVLREEPVPGSTDGYYPERPFRVKDGCFEGINDAGKWVPWDIGGNETDLMRHALDLHARPYRTEEVPIDENNPWGDE